MSWLPRWVIPPEVPCTSVPALSARASGPEVTEMSCGRGIGPALIAPTGRPRSASGPELTEVSRGGGMSPAHISLTVRSPVGVASNFAVDVWGHGRRKGSNRFETKVPGSVANGKRLEVARYRVEAIFRGAGYLETADMY